MRGRSSKVIMQQILTMNVMGAVKLAFWWFRLPLYYPAGYVVCLCCCVIPLWLSVCIVKCFSF